MKKAQVRIPWEEGLHLRPAAKVVQSAQRYSSNILLRVGNKIADGRNILTIIMLAAGFGTVMSVEVSGMDEEEALASVVSVFEQMDSPSATLDEGGAADPFR